MTLYFVNGKRTALLLTFDVYGLFVKENLPTVWHRGDLETV